MSTEWAIARVAVGVALGGVDLDADEAVTEGVAEAVEPLRRHDSGHP